VLESIESSEVAQTITPSYQIYLTPELAHTIESSSKVASELGDEFVSTEHLFISIIEVPGEAHELLSRLR
jgi:ATP-dependent Clp protease ATP-binding subunit ClpB